MHRGTTNATGLQLTVASTALGCFEMVVLLRPDIVSYSVLHRGHWEISSPAHMVAPHELPRSGAFLDIGANLGWFSWLFAQSGHRVFAVEAFPQNQRALATTLCLNRRWSAQVTLAKTAVGGIATAGPCVVESDPGGGKNNNAGNGIVKCGPNQSCDGRAVSTESLNCEPTSMKTVDELLIEWGMPHISIVKMDVEGFECSVLEGAQMLFTQIQPKFIYAELKFSETRRCWLAEAKRHGYRVGPQQGKDRNTLFTKFT